jgi:hypothetical protein
MLPLTLGSQYYPYTKSTQEHEKKKKKKKKLQTNFPEEVDTKILN